MVESSSVVARLERAINEHDLERLVLCFHEDIRSEQPTHPARSFRGREQIRRDWSMIFAGVPDLRATVLRRVAAGDVAWAEWQWQGTRADGSPADMGGVTILGIAGGEIAWVRFYMEPVEQAGADIGAVVRQHATGR